MSASLTEAAPDLSGLTVDTPAIAAAVQDKADRFMSLGLADNAAATAHEPGHRENATAWQTQAEAEYAAAVAALTGALRTVNPDAPDVLIEHAVSTLRP